ncbi:chorismate mutase [Streptacidiphilus pinicola]|uniref:Chorismate mutase n=1 Tax=Streptacidiphilus pinicola TaxID=2219663 RepID=A0A2X0INY8_9ACTN|nr:chorismate mutase [Streptacidiphilus pinicola]RAG86914.1 chorismate mutase [Streptacidiphilus pinicola]
MNTVTSPVNHAPSRIAPKAGETAEPLTAEPLTKEAAEAVIAEARGRIDALDAEILDAVRRRIATSAEVQAARIAVGGPRLSLTREMEILDRYRAQLGGPGTEVAMLLLELCRGRV